MKNLGFLAFVFGLAILLVVIMPAISPRWITRGKSRGVAACVPAGCARTLHVWEESPATFPQIATFHEYSILGSSHVGWNNCKALRRNAGRNSPARCRCSLWSCNEDCKETYKTRKFRRNRSHYAIDNWLFVNRSADCQYKRF